MRGLVLVPAEHVNQAFAACARQYVGEVGDPAFGPRRAAVVTRSTAFPIK